MLRSVSRPWRLVQPRTFTQRFTRAAATKISEPLRVLFCGSDEFSCSSLQALQDERAENTGLIKSIDVVVRPPKVIGRGGKTLRAVPLQLLAEKLGLPIHERDTFTGWQMPLSGDEPINLIIAVSFGLFVPSRLLRATKYGGLNVHSSLLPDLRGPAPIHHALLAGDAHTGVTLQTLDEHAFDAGAILAQTPSPGVPIPRGCTPAQLRAALAPLGAAMLRSALRAGLHVPPLTDAGWRRAALAASGQAARHAPKLATSDRQADWAAPGWSAGVFATRARVLGPLWSRALHSSGAVKRVILEGVEEGAAMPEEAAVFVRRVQRRVREKQQQQQQQQRESGGDAGSMDASSGKDAVNRQALFAETTAEAEAEVDEGDAPKVKTVTWLQEVDSAADSHEEDGPSNTRQFRLPYFIDGDAVLIPCTDGGFVRIASIKIEGERTKPAAKVIESLTDHRHHNNIGPVDFLADILTVPLNAALKAPWLH